jgi:hypothetical protein
MLAVVLGLGLPIPGCTGGSSAAPKARSTVAAHWVRDVNVPGVVDLTGPRSDGQTVVAASGHLYLLDRAGRLAPFASGDTGYATALGSEPYIALSPAATFGGAGCTFGRDTVFAIEPGTAPGVIRVDTQARRFASLPGVAPNGIAFDDVGRFGYRLLVTAATQSDTVVFAVDCAGRVATIASHAPTVEGGIAVAPASFGSFAGDLIAPDEKSGQVWAISPDGQSRLVARSPLASGGDIGVESVAFVPPGFGTQWAAYVADRVTPGNAHPGTDSILRMSGYDLVKSGVRAGDLIIASEAGAQTIVIRCTSACTTRPIGEGPATSHVEGHVMVAQRAPGDRL